MQATLRDTSELTAQHWIGLFKSLEFLKMVQRLFHSHQWQFNDNFTSQKKDKYLKKMLKARQGEKICPLSSYNNQPLVEVASSARQLPQQP